MLKFAYELSAKLLGAELNNTNLPAFFAFLNAGTMPGDIYTLQHAL